MKKLMQYKSFLAIIVFFILAILFYKTFFQLEIADIYTDSSSARNIGASLIDTRAKLQDVNFNQNLFTQESYMLLTDFSVPIAPQTAGRPNPFDVFGRN
jgi:hypothetical protein